MTTTATATEIEVRLNGQAQRLPTGTTLAGLLASLQKDPRTVAIEKNGDIVRRAAFGETSLSAGDVLEIVQFVQGG